MLMDEGYAVQSQQATPSVRSAASNGASKESGLKVGVGFQGVIAWTGMVLSAVVAGPMLIFQLFLRTEDYNVIHGVFRVKPQKVIAWSNSVPLNRIKQIKNHFGCGCTVNDVAMSLVAGALRQYICRRTSTLSTIAAVRTEHWSIIKSGVPSTVTVAMPVNLRTMQEMRNITMRNKFSVTLIDLPLRADDERERLVHVMRATAKAKASIAPFVIHHAMAFAVSVLPLAWASQLIDMITNAPTCVVTNNRGPDEILQKFGRPCTYWVSWAPQRATIAATITVFTYADTLRVSVISDKSTIPQPEQLTEAFMNELQLLLSGCGPKMENHDAGRSDFALPVHVGALSSTSAKTPLRVSGSTMNGSNCIDANSADTDEITHALLLPETR